MLVCLAVFVLVCELLCDGVWCVVVVVVVCVLLLCLNGLCRCVCVFCQ